MAIRNGLISIYMDRNKVSNHHSLLSEKPKPVTNFSSRLRQLFPPLRWARLLVSLMTSFWSAFNFSFRSTGRSCLFTLNFDWLAGLIFPALGTWYNFPALALATVAFLPLNFDWFAGLPVLHYYCDYFDPGFYKSLQYQATTPIFGTHKSLRLKVSRLASFFTPYSW